MLALTYPSPRAHRRKIEHTRTTKGRPKTHVHAVGMYRRTRGESLAFSLIRHQRRRHVTWVVVIDGRSDHDR
jgi:hypothetical protein